MDPKRIPAHLGGKGVVFDAYAWDNGRTYYKTVLNGRPVELHLLDKEQDA